MRVSGGSECQASITLASSAVIVPLPVSGANRCANRFPRGPFSSGFRGLGSGLQIRHPGFESRRRLSSHPVASCGIRVSNASDSLVYATLLYFLVRRIRLFNRGEFARCTDTIPRYGNLVNAGVMTGTFERNGLRLGGLWWNYRLHYVGVASMQELIQG